MLGQVLLPKGVTCCGQQLRASLPGWALRAGTRRALAGDAGRDGGLAARAQVVQAFVRQAMGYVDQAPDKETRVALIEALQTVTEGKVGAPVRMRGWSCWAHCGHVDWHVDKRHRLMCL
jgi:hypothetical protein